MALTGVVQVVPALLPYLRTCRPTRGRPRESEFGRFGEPRLSAAVAADDEGQTGPGPKPKAGAVADPAKTLHGDLAQVHPSRPGGLSLGGRPRPAHVPAPQRLGESVFSQGRGQDEISGSRIQLGRRQTLRDEIDGR